MNKRMIGMFLALCVILTQFSVFPASAKASTGLLTAAELSERNAAPETFLDVPAEHWAYAYIEEAAADGAVNGIGNGNFAPANPLTMAHFVVIVTRAFYAEELAWRTADSAWKENCGYSNPDAWYAASQKVADDHNLFHNVAGGSAIITEPLSRYNMASIIYNILLDKGIQVLDDERARALLSIHDLNDFPDAAFYLTVPAVYALGILTGYSDGTFRGFATMNRAQAAAIYCRLKKVLLERLGSLFPRTPATPTATPAAEITPVPTEIPTPVVSATPVPEATATPTPTLTPTPTPTPIPTFTPTPTPTFTPTPTPTPVPAEADIRTEVLRLVNEARAENGVSAMQLDEALCAAAQTRAEELTEEFSHTRPDGSSCFTILDESGIRYWSAGENIAAGQRTASSVMESWMNSPGHRANILSDSFGTLGVGMARASDGYGIYWCQLFTD